MANHPRRATNNEPKDWMIRLFADANEIREGDLSVIKFRGTYAAAIARWMAERERHPPHVQVTLYGSGPRVREARGTAEG